MALTDAATALTQRHQRAQLQIRALALRAYVPLWPLWTGDAKSFDGLMVTTTIAAQHYHDLSAATAAAYFEAFRNASQVKGTARPVTAPLDTDKFRAALYTTGRIMTQRAIAAGQPPAQAMRTALVRSSGAVTTGVLSGGRDTISASSDEDGYAHGWTRVTSGGCAFCEMLASRGPVYSESSVEFEAHDHCACGAEPYYGGGEEAWPPSAQAAKARYETAIENAHASGTLAGNTTNDRLNAFRRHLSAQATG